MDSLRLNPKIDLNSVLEVEVERKDLLWYEQDKTSIRVIEFSFTSILLLLPTILNESNHGNWKK